MVELSRNDITKSIESLTSKWQRDEKDNAKRVAATLGVRADDVTSAEPLDNISEVRHYEFVIFHYY